MVFLTKLFFIHTKALGNAMTGNPPKIAGKILVMPTPTLYTDWIVGIKIAKYTQPKIG